MEIVLKQGDRLPVPEGCKAVVEGDVVLIESKKQEFKDGDILASTERAIVKTILIFKGKEPRRNSFRSHFNSSGLNEEGWAYTLFRYATDEEKQALFDKMKEKGLQWNAEEKRVEKIRWRAEIGEFYYTLGVYLNVCKETEENFGKDDKAFRSGIYFRTYEQAKKAAAAVRETLKKFHEENEENL